MDTVSSSARAPILVLKIFGPRPKWRRGRKVKDGVRTLVVPGSFEVKVQAEAEGPGPSVHGCRFRLARARVLYVSGDERRQVGAR